MRLSVWIQISTLVVAVTAGTSQPAAAQTAPLGMILRTDGDVTVLHAGDSRRARLGEFVYANDRLVTPANGRAMLMYCPSNERISVAGGTTLEIAAAAVRAAQGPAPTRSPVKCALPQVALGAENLERVGGLRPRGDPPISLYTGGPVTAARPRFSWMPVEGTRSYRHSVRDANGRTIGNWESPAGADESVLPEPVAALAPGSYQWELVAQGDGRIVGRQMATLEVRPNSELGIPAPSDPAARLAHAVALENGGYFAEAAALFRELRGNDRTDERMGRHLIWLYWSARLFAAMNVEIDRIGGIR